MNFNRVSSPKLGCALRRAVGARHCNLLPLMLLAAERNVYLPYNKPHKVWGFMILCRAAGRLHL